MSPYNFCRLLLNVYKNQKLRLKSCKWNGVYSDLMNGVKQRGSYVTVFVLCLY